MLVLTYTNVIEVITSDIVTSDIVTSDIVTSVVLSKQGWISPYKFLVPCLSVRVKCTNQ